MKIWKCFRESFHIFRVLCTADDVDLRISTKYVLENKSCNYFYTNQMNIAALKIIWSNYHDIF